MLRNPDLQSIGVFEGLTIDGQESDVHVKDGLD